MDDNRYMKFVAPNITRISQSIEGMAHTSCTLLNGMIQEGRSNSTSIIRLKSTLIQGDSVAAYHPEPKPDDITVNTQIRLGASD